MRPGSSSALTAGAGERAFSAGGSSNFDGRSFGGNRASTCSRRRVAKVYLAPSSSPSLGTSSVTEAIQELLQSTVTYNGDEGFGCTWSRTFGGSFSQLPFLLESSFSRPSRTFRTGKWLDTFLSYLQATGLGVDRLLLDGTNMELVQKTKDKVVSKLREVAPSPQGLLLVGEVSKSQRRAKLWASAAKEVCQ